MYTPTLEVWKHNDKRLPLTVKREPPSKAFCDSMKEVQISPIGMVKNGKDWILAYGNKRIAAARINKQDILVFVFKDVPIDEIPKLTAYENMHRSDNEITDFLSIRELLRQPGATYETCAKSLGISVSRVKAIESKWHKVPQWVLNAVYAGEIAPSTAKRIGGLKPSVQKKLEKNYDPEIGITAGMISETQDVVIKDLMQTLISEPPKIFNIRILDLIEEALKSNDIDSALQIIQETRKGNIQ